MVNFLSALAWAPAYILPGVFFGDIYAKLEKHIDIKTGSIILISISMLFALYIIKRSRHNKK
jgi:membrane protein DedA with SNARE-associated domain